MLGKRVSGNQLFKIFWGRPHPRPHGLRAFGARGQPALSAAAPRTSTQSCRESMPSPQIDFIRYACGPGVEKEGYDGKDLQKRTVLRF